MTKLLDPVCGMTVDATSFRAPGHDDVAFCAPGCRTTFLRDPAAYSNRLRSTETITMIPTVIADRAGSAVSTEPVDSEEHGR